MQIELPALFELSKFQQLLSHSKPKFKAFKETLKTAEASLASRFEQGVPVTTLVRQRAELIDQLLIQCWQLHFPDEVQQQAALVAVGGYGRSELHPCSDIDIMILLKEQANECICSHIEQFLTILWDTGMEVGSSVRTIGECIHHGSEDVTIATNLMEARHITGNESLFKQMRHRVGPSHIWPSNEFFAAKLQEQVIRHNKYNDTAYNLEPNLKEGPGGLRDIQIIGWVSKRHLNVDTLSGLVERGFLIEQEYQQLIQGQTFLWRIRTALHHMNKRREDRLLIDDQRKLADLFGYKESDNHLAVELFMKEYYRTIRELSCLNEMLLQLFKEEILYANEPDKTKPLNPHFQIRKGFIEATETDLFQKHPPALLEIFLLLEQNHHLKGVRAGTIRLIHQNLHRINPEFRSNPDCNALFIDILSQPEGVTHELRRMHRYGVLGAYLPNFDKIIGQMQHDLFHVYTVDEHTLGVLRNVRRFSVPEFAHEYPLCSQRFHQLKKPELLYIAALFHDIAKGRGGDHSQLGAVDAWEFCVQHHLDEEDAEMVSWLVKNHLLMSSTAQGKDLSDIAVINQFATNVGSRQRLDALYLLTVADIRSTSPAVWNTWKASLLKELFYATSRALSQGLDNPLEQQERLAHSKQMALEELALHRISPEMANQQWQRLDQDYFQVHSADEIAWQTRHIINARQEKLPLIVLRQMTRRGGTEVFLYTINREYLFARVTAALEQLNLNIADARIVTSNDGYTLDTFIILDKQGEAISEQSSLSEIATTIKRYIDIESGQLPTINKRAATQLKHFPIPTKVSFQHDKQNKRTIMKVVTSDRPGVLARIGAALWQQKIELHNAKIATFGERAQDLFFITNKEHQPLWDQGECDSLRHAIIQQLSSA
ncbi:[Protein-PII] uridylyltransferase / [Protein-PII]-UMP uridylyl-removing enzyme [hydrothermal vent metagenome]|uniref:[Protein-PII] uridylyltransferase / [Protein-PII]-UMP uridylyl-removing enzyme n=1 Tax=hydrothermal vent metagenome TaxID=652676 RepID=A0A3B0ZT42_9ZZZZ